jgi:hypothetical protein
MDMEGLPISIRCLALLLLSAFFSLPRMPQPAHGRRHGEATAAARASRIYWQAQAVDQMVACALVLTALLATYIYH